MPKGAAVPCELTQGNAPGGGRNRCWRLQREGRGHAYHHKQTQPKYGNLTSKHRAYENTTEERRHKPLHH